jgi:hypothetical protein
MTSILTSSGATGDKVATGTAMATRAVTVAIAEGAASSTATESVTVSEAVTVSLVGASTLTISITQGVTVSATPTLLGPPAIPGNVTATAISASRIDLAWTHDGLNTDGYSIERSLTGVGSWSEIDTTTDKFYSDTGLTQNTTYYYRIRAYRA